MKAIAVAAGLAFIAPPAPSQQPNVNPSSYSIHIEDQTRTLLVTAYIPVEQDGVQITALANNAAVAQIVIESQGSTLITCPGVGGNPGDVSQATVCNFFWTVDAMVAMNCVNCQLLAVVTETGGRTYRVMTEVIRP